MEHRLLTDDPMIPEVGWRCEFSLDHYGHILDQSRLLGYRIYPFSAWLETDARLRGERTILLRHDVDVSVERALKIARFERERGVTATFFCRLHGGYYDPRDPDIARAIGDLATIADVGLHYELMHYEAVGGDQARLLRRDREEMARILGIKEFGCAAHMPGKYGSLGEDLVRSVGLAFEAYSAQFMKERKYISDSGARWREGCLCRWLGEEDHLTVLVHPVWWTDWPESSARVIQRLGEGY